MRAFSVCCALLVLVVFVPTAQAHHPGHAASSRGSGQYSPFLLGSGGPKTRLTYTFDWSHLDNSAGDVYLNQIEGEYSIVDGFSVLLRVPILSLQFNFRPSKTGIGDIAFGIKGRLFQDDKHSLMLGNDVSFPTGNRNNGTGSGAVITSPYLAYQYDFGFLQAYGSVGTSFELDNNPEPSLLPSAGVSIPLLKQGIPLTAFVSLRGQILFADETFQRGSSKVYLMPGLIIYPLENKRLSLVVSGTVSIIDTLKVKSGVTLNNDSLALSQDILAGATLQINYSF